MGSDDIPDSHITSSSFLEGYGPELSRFSRQRRIGAWCPSKPIDTDAYEWLQVKQALQCPCLSLKRKYSIVIGKLSGLFDYTGEIGHTSASMLFFSRVEYSTMFACLLIYQRLV